MRLTATFTIPLSSTVVFRGDDRPRKYLAAVDGFDVELTITPVDGARSKGKNERLWTYMAEQFTIAVSGDESESPPEIQVTATGGRDFRARVPYFQERLPAYARVASQVFNNAITFLRFQLRQPLIRALREGRYHMSDAAWSDDRGREIDSGQRTFVVRAVPGTRNELGVVKLERKHDKLLRAAFANSKQPTLHAEILSDAQAAAFDGNIRRAVLELAIACEVFAKHTFYGGDNAAAQVFEALEDRGKAHVRVLDLIDIGGTALFGTSFQVKDKNAYRDIEHLFRARNKVAHRGEAIFRDEKGHVHAVDMKLLNRWWHSVDKLFKWAG